MLRMPLGGAAVVPPPPAYFTPHLPTSEVFRYIMHFPLDPCVTRERVFHHQATGRRVSVCVTHACFAALCAEEATRALLPAGARCVPACRRPGELVLVALPSPQTSPDSTPGVTLA